MGKDKRKLKILNLKHHQPKHKYDFKVDRSTPLGNPYYITAKLDRKASIKLFEKYCKYIFKKKSSERTKEDKAFLKYFNQIVGAYKKYGKVRLFCHCAPLSCHAKIIIKFIKKGLK